MLWSEALAEKVPNMAENNKNEVADVCCQEVIVGRLIHHGLRELSSHVFADISMAWTNQGTELSVNLGLSLLFCN